MNQEQKEKKGVKKRPHNSSRSSDNKAVNKRSWRGGKISKQRAKKLKQKKVKLVSQQRLTDWLLIRKKLGWLIRQTDVDLEQGPIVFSHHFEAKSRMIQLIGNSETRLNLNINWKWMLNRPPPVYANVSKERNVSEVTIPLRVVAVAQLAEQSPWLESSLQQYFIQSTFERLIREKEVI